MGTSSAAAFKSQKRLEAEEPTSDEDSDVDPKPRLGAGNLGLGAPLATMVAGRLRNFDDGNGLCTPGQWPPERRCADASGTARNISAALRRSSTLNRFIFFSRQIDAPSRLSRHMQFVLAELFSASA